MLLFGKLTWYVSSPGCDAVWSSGSCNSLKHDRVTMGGGQMGERDRGKSNEVNLLFPQGIIRGNYSAPHTSLSVPKSEKIIPPVCIADVPTSSQSFVREEDLARKSCARTKRLTALPMNRNN